MKTYLRIGLVCVYILNIHTDILAAYYPQTKGEARREAMGSINEAEGLIFRPQRIQNDSTKNSIASKVNKYLWQASLEVVKAAPLASVDSNSGIIITDWYSPEDKQNYNFKINIFIKDEIISPNSIEVRIFQQKLQGGRWVPVNNNVNLSNILENKILLKARELYINSTGSRK